VAVTTLQGSGSIQASGGGRSYGGGGGGGRVAVYAQDFSDFNTANITARGGNGDQGGGAGTIYLRNTANANGTLIVDNGTQKAGTTPLGLPGESSHAFPDAVVIEGSGTQAIPENAGLVLDFQSTLTVTQGATLTVAGPGLQTEQALRVTAGAMLSVTGAWGLSAPLTLLSAQIQVNGSLTASQALTVDGSTLVGGTIAAPSLSVVNGAVVTSFSATTTQVFQLDLNVTGTLTVDGTSRIDVSGEGYQPGYTTGNTTVGAATGQAGGSYGGLGAANNGTPNAVYGDYANPNDWGSGASGGGSGGGLVRITAGVLRLDGNLLAQGGEGDPRYYDGSGSGGGIY
jgi:large repetitive protein